MTFDIGKVMKLTILMRATFSKGSSGCSRSGINWEVFQRSWGIAEEIYGVSLCSF